MTSEAQSQPNFWARLSRAVSRFFGVLLRLLFVVLLAAALAAGVYYGLPWVYQSLIQPVQTHTTQIDLLSGRLDNVGAGFAEAQSLQDERLTSLETAGDDQRQRVGATEIRLAEAEAALAAEAEARAALANQVSELTAALEAQTTATGALAESQDELAPKVAAAAADAAQLQERLALLSLENGLLQARLQVVAENLGEARRLMAESAPALRGFIEGASGRLPAELQAALLLRVTTAEGLIEAEPATALTELEAVWAQIDRSLAEAGEE